MVQWIQKAAGQGHAGAQWKLGCLYLTGRGVKRNEAEAIQWIQKAAVQGDAGAQSRLERMYFEGRGVEKNDRQAAYWLLKSGLSADGLTLSCAGNLPVELVKFLPPLFAETPEWQRVRTLDLSRNTINDEAAANLVQLITENQTLEVLNLRGNPIGENGAAFFAVALRSNQTLKELHLDLTGITELARADIARALDSNKNIATLAKEVEANPAQKSDELPLEVVDLIEQATIVADQKAGDANHTLEQTRQSINELRLAVAQQFITGQNQPAMD